LIFLGLYIQDMNTQFYELCSLNPRLWVPLRNNNYQASLCKYMEYVSTRSGLWSSWWITLIQSSCSHSDFVRCISIFTSHLGAGLVDTFLQIFQPKPTKYLYYLTHAICLELDFPDNIWQKVQIMNLGFFVVSSVIISLLFLWPKYFFQHFKTLSNVRESFMLSQNSWEIENFKLIRKIAKSDK